MNNTYTWTITALDCIPEINDRSNYVVIAHWLCEGSDGVYTGQQVGTVTFVVDPYKTDYVPYQDLTEAEVIVWTQDALGADTVQLIYRTIDTQIQAQVNPAVVQPPLPWAPQ